MTAKEIAALGETAVCRYLEAQEYRILARNFRIPGGELDIVACRGAELCFVEVKTRQIGSISDPADAVDARKQRLMLRTASAFCEKIGISMEDWYLRFDAAAVTVQRGAILSIDYLEDAFTADS